MTSNFFYSGAMNRVRKSWLHLYTTAALLLTACGAAPTPTLAPSPPPSSIPPALIEAAAEFCPAPPNWYLYLTQPGDTLRSLAERTSSSVTELATANCLNNPRALASGQVVYIPRRPITP